MKEHKLGIIMNGVTGRMGTNQHLIRSICAIREQGGIQVSPDEVITVDPILTGRNENKLKALAERTGVRRWTTNIEQALADQTIKSFLMPVPPFTAPALWRWPRRRGKRFIVRNPLRSPRRKLFD